jgi:class 3 adenylate cyclase
VTADQLPLPSGTVTFLFTDIEGSTRLWEADPAGMRIALERHDEILRGAIVDHGGFVFSTAGDSFAAVFGRGGDGVLAAVRAQRELGSELWPEAATVRVRMGLHTGEAHERDGDYFGSAVNRTARLMGSAHGGQVLVSLAVEDLVRDELGGGCALVSLGEHALRGLTRPEVVFQVTGPGLEADFAELDSASLRRGNLPTPATSFVGRADDVKDLGAVAVAQRLVTLVGPGGVGKTRLAIETAASVADEYRDGVWFVELAPLAEPAAVIHAVASALSVRPEEGLTVLESVVHKLANRRALLVLDNCEHLLGAAAQIAVTIGRDANRVTSMATSREPLGIAGEQVWPVEPLDPALEAVDLFVERASLGNPAFHLANDDRRALVGLCAALDGIPLAVELAAGRARSMTVQELTDRLDDRFRLLRGSRHSDADHRQRTLLATVEWSYQLLDDDERILFDRLSVFAGGFDIDTA